MQTEAFNRPAFLKAGIALAAVAVLANIPYAALIALFDYDDVLRRPAGEVLTKFHEGGAQLVLAWWTFALSAVGLAIAAALTGDALKAGPARLSTTVTIFGILSGAFQAVALLRWTFVIPQLSAAYLAAPEGSATRAAAATSYEMLNGFAGAGMGEHLGQVLLMIWTLGLGLALLRMGGAFRWIGAFGLATLPAWIVGQTELLAPSMPGLPVIEVIPYAFMAWELFLLALGIALIAKAVRREQGTNASLATA